MAWLRKRSQTIDQLSRLISYLPQERRKALWQILPISVLPGLGFSAGGSGCKVSWALVGNNLEDKLPGVRVFGGKPLDQTLWLIALFIGLAWFASFSKLFLQLVQQKLTARIWRDLSNEIHARVLRQNMIITSPVPQRN